MIAKTETSHIVNFIIITSISEENATEDDRPNAAVNDSFIVQKENSFESIKSSNEFHLAEAEGFEPPWTFIPTVFKTASL